MNDCQAKDNAIIEQWRVCVEMANSVSTRRDTMNNLFVTLNLGLVAAITYTLRVQSVVLSLLGCILCVIWLLLIKYYRALNETKFSIIHDLERQLPEAPFTDEWTLINEKKGFVQGTKLEIMLPITFIVLHTFVTAFLYWRWFN